MMINRMDIKSHVCHKIEQLFCYEIRTAVAEDDDAVRNMLRAVLERDGFEVVAVANIRLALSRRNH